MLPGMITLLVWVDERCTCTDRDKRSVRNNLWPKLTIDTKPGTRIALKLIRTYILVGSDMRRRESYEDGF